MIEKTQKYRKCPALIIFFTEDSGNLILCPQRNKSNLSQLEGRGPGGNKGKLQTQEEQDIGV